VVPQARQANFRRPPKSPIGSRPDKDPARACLTSLLPRRTLATISSRPSRTGLLRGIRLFHLKNAAAGLLRAVLGLGFGAKRALAGEDGHRA